MILDIDRISSNFFKNRFIYVLLLSASVFSACQLNNDNIQTDNAVTIDSTLRDDTLSDSLAEPDTTTAASYGANTGGKDIKKLVRKSLRELYKDDLSKNLVDNKSRKFIFFTYDLKQDSTKEIFVGLTGPSFCNTNGCTILLLDENGKLINTFSGCDYPVIVAHSKTDGWNDLIISSNGADHLLKFSGRSYPSNPSTQAVLQSLPEDSLPHLLDYTNQPYKWFKF